MKIDLKKLRQRGKDAERFYFEYTPEDAVLTLPGVVFNGPVKVTGEAELLSKSGVFVRAEVAVSLAGACSRCLAETENAYVFQLEEEFVSGESEELYTYQNDILDLTKAVTDRILLDLPMAFLCREDCTGLCPVCGADLNEGDCGCQS